jgi:Flp pilus assembly pilin Flp
MNLPPCPPTGPVPLDNIRVLLGDRSGAIGVEYGLIAALVVLAILGSIKALGVSLGTLPLASIVAVLS